MEFEIVPIVYGKADYDQLLPSNSYINALNFSNAGVLASYLKKLANDSAAYESYFKWKQNYLSIDSGWSFLCDICSKLNDDYLTTTKRNVYEWWFVEGACEPPTETFS